MTGAVQVLDDAQRAGLAALADTLIPGGSGLPSASAAEVHGQWIDRALAARPELADAVLAVIGTVPEPVAGLGWLADLDRSLADRFTFAVAGAYFMNPVVRRALGYPGTAPRPLLAAPDEAEFYLDDDVLGPVLARGHVFRQPPEEPAR
ncbi:MAG: hypothetical protein JWR66_597 [Modestobacter sp.]|jgi:hypothetical protein|nr:hypothetical protein [Modestobacter sp.]MCW2574567.1 hypothetical protein [Modestobacter sp.]